MGDRFWGLYGEFGVQGMGFGFWTWGGFGGGHGGDLGEVMGCVWDMGV